MSQPLEGRLKPHLDLSNVINFLQNCGISGILSAKPHKSGKTVIIPDVDKPHPGNNPTVNKPLHIDNRAQGRDFAQF